MEQKNKIDRKKPVKITTYDFNRLFIYCITLFPDKNTSQQLNNYPLFAAL